jgi:aspartyl-tRNA(Asn)/glutamyl-tRNA(Gln) amidotransferase subunit A
VGHCTRGINYLGLPAVTVPAGFDSRGLPVAFQLVGRPFSEAKLLQAADAYQRVTDWHRRLPPGSDSHSSR